MAGCPLMGRSAGDEGHGGIKQSERIREREGEIIWMSHWSMADKGTPGEVGGDNPD